MIITQIASENFLKYTHLALDDIPRQGVITISGQNESGKSTIGETVCFALFGRTFSIPETEIVRVIRWGESRCNVRLGFSVGDKDYEITRYLDSEGNHGARLYPTDDESHPLAKGVNAVKEALDDLLGYQFEEFVESFYLAQREITTPHPHSHAVKTVAGISALESVADVLSGELKNEQRRKPDIDEQIATVEADIKDLNIEPRKLIGLESDVKENKQVCNILQEKKEALSTAAQKYKNDLSSYTSAKSFKWVTGFLTCIFFILAIGSGVSWTLFNFIPDANSTLQLKEILNTFSLWNDVYIDRLQMIFLISSVFFLFCWLVYSRFKRKSSRFKQNGIALTDTISAASEVITFSDKKILNSQDFYDLRLSKLSSDQSTAFVSLVSSQLQHEITEQEVSLESLEKSLSEEQARHSKSDTLTGVITNLSEKIDEIQHRILLREIAEELIISASRHFSQRFNKDLRELASRTLPLFTEDRYEHLHINDDLDVRAFSNLKRDYMDLDEISSGTQRQIMLAVRLALSQELVNTTGCGDQFIFLDEPFAFFDQTRTRNAMAILPKLSEEINQIWVIAQEFPDDTHYDLEIVCSREYDSLPQK